MSATSIHRHVRQTNSRELYPAQHLDDDPGQPMLVVENALGRAVIALQGAQVMAFQPAGQRELLWVSPRCIFAPGKAMRGGIPLCLPWFGPATGNGPQHGFARTSGWTLTEETQLPGGATRLILELVSDTPFSALWPHPFDFRLEVVVGTTLTLRLCAENRGPQTAPLAFAFHCYLAVPDVAEARLVGLDDTTYIDKLEASARKHQNGDVRLSAETDRVYLDVPPEQTLYTAAGATQITSDCTCCIVWNAWNNDRNIADLGAGNHRGYLCVEPGDVADHAVTLPPGETYCRTMTLSAV